MDYKETIKERLRILPDELRDFLLDESWREDARKIGEEFSLDEEKYAAFENEVFLTLLCFEPRKDLAENLKNEAGVDESTAKWLAEDAESHIFGQVKEELDAIEKQINENENREAEAKPPMQPSNKSASNVGQSFEQIILNQAKAMQPARPAAAPDNLPVSEEPKVIHNYLGQDPYREPLG